MPTFVRLALVAVVAAACASPPSTPPPPASTPGPTVEPIPTTAPLSTAGASESPAGPLGREAAWRADIVGLVPAMAAIHPDLAHGTSRAELDGAAAALAASVSTATDDELLVGVLELVAMVSRGGCDSHTGAFVWGTGTYPVDSLPLRLWLFDDDIVIVDALPPYDALIGSRIETLEGRPSGEVLAALEPLIPRDNEQTVRLLLPRYLLMPQVLRGLGLAGDGPVRIEVANPSGERRAADVAAIPMADYNAWAGPYGLHLPGDPSVRWLSRIDDPLWWDLLADGRTLYVQYNRVEPLAPDRLASLREALRGEDIEQVILDLRHNYGGEVSALAAIEGLFMDPAIDRPGASFALIGRNTYSAASLLVARLQQDTHATLVGEAMGGCPTLYGDPEPIRLLSGIEVSVASRLEAGVDPEDDRLTIEPDARAILTLDEWLGGEDPALDAIIGAAP